MVRSGFFRRLMECPNMELHNIEQIITAYLYKYNVPHQLHEEVCQDVLLQLMEDCGQDWQERADAKKILEVFGNVVERTFNNELRGYIDVYQLDPEDEDYLSIMDIDLQHLTKDHTQQSNLRFAVLGLSPDHQRFTDLAISRTQFMLYEKQYNQQHPFLLNAYNRCDPDPKTFETKSEKSQNNQKTFGAGHILYAKRLYPHTKRGVVEKIVELHNQGMTWQGITHHFKLTKWKGRLTKNPRATALEVKAILQCMYEVSDSQLKAWLKINEEPLQVSIDTPESLISIVTLEDLEAFLNIQLNISCKIVHSCPPYILVRKKCKTCNSASQIHIYANDAGGFTFSCGRCAAKNNHHGIYKRAGGNSLAGALRHLNILTREDFES